MKIENFEINGYAALAPMAGVADRAFRELCIEFDASYVVTEMVSSKGLTMHDRKSDTLMQLGETEKPAAVQIFGCDPATMAEAAKKAAETGCCAIDINMGCPAPKIAGNGGGSALMKDPNLAAKITEAVVKAVEIPVTVKFRSGWDENSINAVECALAAEEGGASLICIHGRTREQMYGGLADREIIKNVKSALHIPLIANGDIIDGQSAVTMLRETNADGIAIGRGAVGNPFIFSEIISALEGKAFIEPSIEERIDIALLQLRTAIEEKGERLAIPEARKQIALYLRSFHGAARIRAEINRALTYREVETALRSAL